MVAYPASRRETLEDAFPRLNTASTSAFNDGDLDACTQFYAEDSALLIPDRPVIRGRGNIKSYLAELYDSGAKLLPVEPVLIESRGDFGYCAGTCRLQSPDENHTDQAGTSKFVTVFQRERDDSWVAVIDSIFADVGTVSARINDPSKSQTDQKTNEIGGDEYAPAKPRDVYQKGARYYDSFVWPYYAAGMRINHWRRKVIEALALQSGDTVVETGCGTGFNFALLDEAVGDTGRIIGVDISEAMLERAEARIHIEGWKKIELACCSASDDEYPQGVGGIFAAGVLNYEPDYDQVIARGAEALSPGRRWVVLDYKRPSNWLRHLTPLFVFLGSAFGVSADRMQRRPLDSIQQQLQKCRMEALYGGFVYIVSGEAS